MSMPEPLENTLFSVPQKFDGETYEPEHDEVRLTGQLLRAYELMKDGRYRTLKLIAELIGCSETSASARLRDLRKPRFGKHTVVRRRVEGGLHEYAFRAHGTLEKENDDAEA